MIGSYLRWASYFPWLVGSLFVLWAVLIGPMRKSKRYLKDSELLKIVTELTAVWKTRTRGHVRIAAMAGISIFVIGMVGMAVFNHKLEEYPTIEMHNVEVEQAVGELSYWFIDETGNRFYATFCDTLGYPPPFDRGETIVVLKFKNRGTCWDMHDVHPKYVMLRDQDGNLKIKEN